MLLSQICASYRGQWQAHIPKPSFVGIFHLFIPVTIPILVPEIAFLEQKLRNFFFFFNFFIVRVQEIQQSIFIEVLICFEKYTISKRLKCKYGLV